MARASPIRDSDPPQQQIVRYALTTRQVAELRRVGISMGVSASEVLRRLLDSWIERRRTAAR